MSLLPTKSALDEEKILARLKILEELSIQAHKGDVDLFCEERRVASISWGTITSEASCVKLCFIHYPSTQSGNRINTAESLNRMKMRIQDGVTIGGSSFAYILDGYIKGNITSKMTPPS